MATSRQLVPSKLGVDREGRLAGSSSDDSDSDGSSSSSSSGESGEQQLVALEDRIDAALLEEVKPYEAIPNDAAEYQRAGFWDERYQELDDLVFEWYHPWENLAPSMIQYMDQADDVLVCGCGNSALSAAMYDEGFSRITNVDFSRVAIDQMKARHPPHEYPGMQWKVMDLILTDFASGSFDCAIDKTQASKYLLEIDRILRDDGVLMIVSSGRPEERLEVLERWEMELFDPFQLLPWDVHVDAIAKPTIEAYDFPDLNDPDQVYFIYVCMKDPAKVAIRDRLKKKAEADQAKRLAKLGGKTRKRPPGKK